MRNLGFINPWLIFKLPIRNANKRTQGGMMVKKKLIGIMIAVIGSIMSVVSLGVFYLYSIPQVPVIRKLVFGLFSILGILSLPAIVIQ